MYQKYAGGIERIALWGVADTVVGDDSVTLTLAKPGSYDVTDLGSMMFSAKDSADLKNERFSIGVSVQFVYKDAEGVKTILDANGSYTFKTIDAPGDTNGDGIVDLIDLSNAIDLFGVKEGDDLWSDAEFCDSMKTAKSTFWISPTLLS